MKVKVGIGGNGSAKVLTVKVDSGGNGSAKVFDGEGEGW